MSTPESPSDQPRQPNQEPRNWTQYSQPTYQSQPPQTGQGVPVGSQPRRAGMSGCVAVVLTCTILLVVCGGIALVGGFGTGAFSGNTANTGPQVPTPPAATATATPATAQQAIADIANGIPGMTALGSADISVTFTAKTGYAAIMDTIAGSTLDPAATAQIIKNGTFALMKQLFTTGLPIKEVYYRVDGPLVNSVNGQPLIGPYAEVTLTAATAKRFSWSNLSPDQAWQDYDSAFVRTR